MTAPNVSKRNGGLTGHGILLLGPSSSNRSFESQRVLELMKHHVRRTDNVSLTSDGNVSLLLWNVIDLSILQRIAARLHRICVDAEIDAVQITMSTVAFRQDDSPSGSFAKSKHVALESEPTPWSPRVLPHDNPSRLNDNAGAYFA